MVDQQEALERQRELYQEKNEHLERFLEPVAPYEFYREIFPEGSFERKGHFEDRKGNGIAVTVQKVEVDKATGIALQIEGDGKAKRCTITDELDELRELQDTDFTIMSPISYFGLRRCGKNARYLYALVFDLDGVGMPQLRDTLHQMNKDILPPGNLCCKQRDGASPILCVERASAYVSAQPEMLEGAEIFPYSADLEPIYLHDKRTANAGHFAGLSGGRLRLETGTGVPCEGVPAWRAGGTGAAARLYSGQQRGEAAA